MSLKISCLPIAGIENPYQYLMMEGLTKDDKLEVGHGIEGKFFSLFKTAFYQKPDYIHVDWLHQYYLRRTSWMTWIQFPFFILEILLVKYIFKVKLVWTLHNIKPHDQPYYGPYKWARLFFAKQTAWIRVFSNHTVKEASKILQVSEQKFKVVAEGDYVNYYDNKISFEGARKKLELEKQDFVFLFFGGIRPYKGIEDLIDYFKKFQQTNWKLIIAGMSRDPIYEESIRAKINGNKSIIFIPKLIEVNEIQDYMNAANVVVLPFKKIENSGSTILAMGFKKAVIAPKKGVLPNRLSAQHELLFENKLEEIFMKISSIPQDAFNQIGIENFNNLSNHKWEDFAKCFN
jgi:beta-1,4-mannosyltransferase